MVITSGFSGVLGFLDSDDDPLHIGRDLLFIQIIWKR